MKIELDDDQVKIVLECLGTCHAVEFMKGKAAPHLEKVIVTFGTQLKEKGKLEIFESVFEDLGKSV